MKKVFILIYLIFATSFTPIAGKYVVNEITPITLAFSRFFIACILFYIVFRYKKMVFNIDKKDILRFLILGALVIPINQSCFLFGLSLSYSSHSGVIYSLTALFTFIIAIITRNERFIFKKLVTIILSIIGIILIFYENLHINPSSEKNIFWGDILFFFAVLSWSLYLIMSIPMVRKYVSIKTSLISYIIGLILMSPFLIIDTGKLDFSNITFLGVLGFIHLAVLVAFGSYFVFTYSTKLISISSLTVMTNASPVITIIFSVILLNENPSAYFFAGAIITILGVFLTQIFSDKVKLTDINYEQNQ
jgi:drug/metabolite transporter (DMT)-like permease